MTDAEQELVAIQQAVALLYDGKSAPRLVAKGEHALAREIVELAHTHDIPLCDNAGLVALLMQLELDEEIPENLYLAVAHILAFAFELRGITPEDLR
ncbi:EscU/YscU/HrcU family type III secretion system export apparatus switch protein [Simiduia agarivorans]|uniref:Flagellar biosynthetic protein FlhB n=1 Tax=Simiduia agarivorans (strain DSM 21679 / JCM 13881 / BCRC 17597 / SA1) TaxID=1117647 RepID=K4KH66_SIMAS|nr:EscU/YscU/HrcU family type III secretion system export apparatus switch protein [Simiduia agarivorans]AFU97283.1 FlhB domain-containing protein [Simiduia agarivorans SA1 = DSM 21679]